MPKHLSSLKILSILLLSLMSAVAMAVPVGPMSYQGRLLDSNGVPVTGNQTFKIRIYDDLDFGVLKYQEDYNNVSVNDGVYALKIGNGPKTGGDSLWNTNLWQGNLNDLYLEIEVEGETLAPRSELTSAPHAFTATLALSANSLGARTAAEYDNILEGICVGDKGKWLSTVMRCAGNTADLSGALWSDLDPGNNYSNLDLTQTNFTNANFATVNFSGAVMKGVNIDNANFSSANFTGATLDGATFTSPPNFTSANLSGANMMNMDLSSVDLSSATLNNFSAAKLSGCAGIGLPAGWECVEQSTGLYALVGVSGNYSHTSAGLISRYGSDSYLDLDDVGAITNMSNSDFSGSYVDMNFMAALNLSNAIYDYAQISRSIFQTSNLDNVSYYGARLDWVIFNQADINATIFDWAILTNATFEWAGMSDASFYAARIASSSFSQLNNGSTFYDGVAANTDFRYVKIRDSLFDACNLGGLDFTDAFITNTAFKKSVLEDTAYTYIDMTDARLNNVTFSGSSDALDFDFTDAYLSEVIFKDEDLDGSWFHGSYLYDVVFDDALLWDVEFTAGAEINYTRFNNADLWDAQFTGVTIDNSSFDGANLTGVDFTGATITSSTFVGATWSDTTCPDGDDASDGSPGCEDQL